MKKTESELRDELCKLGLGEVIANVRFEERVMGGISQAVPCFEADKLEFDKFSVREFSSHRMKVFGYNGAVIKSGERGAFVNYVGGHGCAHEKSARCERSFHEYVEMNRDADKERPVVRPICLLKDWSAEEHYLVEPRGVSLLDLSQQGGIRHAEREKTLDAFDNLFCMLEHSRSSYDPDESEELAVLNHVIRFPFHKSYMLLITDNPIFVEGYDYDKMGKLKQDMKFLIEHAFAQRM